MNATILGSGVALPVSVANGGTGLTSYAIGDLVTATGATTLASLADVATGQVLTSGGVGVAPAWSAAPTISGIVTLSNATASSSTSTGALVVTGGVGIGGMLQVGASLKVTQANGVSGVQIVAFNASNGAGVEMDGGNRFDIISGGSSEAAVGGVAVAGLLAIITNNFGTVAMTVTNAGVVAFPQTTEATNAGAGAVTLSGGLYTTKKVFPAGGLLGSNTNDSAAAGCVGELISTTIASASAVSLTTATQANLASVSLTAGDWDVSCTFIYIPAATTSITQMAQGVSQTSATLPTITTGAGDYTVYSTAATVPGANNISQTIEGTRVSLASTTTVYAVAKATFTVSTLTVFGTIRARRIR